jgi:hypothetical protein
MESVDAKNGPRAGRRAVLLAAGAAAAALAAPAASAAGPGSGKAGLLVTGQSNAGFFLEEGIWTMNEGLAALLGIERAHYDPRLDGLRELDGYALRDGVHRSPAMATTFGGTPLWAPGDRDAFLAHQPGAFPSRWPRGTAGQALDRFVRELLTDRDRAECLGVLWLHTEGDSKAKRMRDAETHAAAVKRHLALVRAAFGRPATGPGELPAYAWAPIPFGDSAEGHRAVRAALAAVAADPGQNFRLAVPQTADSEGRDGGRDWSHRDAPDLRAFARRAAYAIARHQRERRGLGPGDLPGPGPRVAEAWAEDARTTVVAVAHDRGRALKASRAALDGRGWSVLDDGQPRAVNAIELPRGGGDRIVLRHEPCSGAPGRREVGYCLFGEQVGRGNAVSDDWASHGAPPRGLDPAAWRFDFPLQATLLPVPVLQRGR